MNPKDVYSNQKTFHMYPTIVSPGNMCVLNYPTAVFQTLQKLRMYLTVVSLLKMHILMYPVTIYQSQAKLLINIYQLDIHRLLNKYSHKSRDGVVA